MINNCDDNDADDDVKTMTMTMVNDEDDDDDGGEWLKIKIKNSYDSKETLHEAACFYSFYSQSHNSEVKQTRGQEAESSFKLHPVVKFISCGRAAVPTVVVRWCL